MSEEDIPGATLPRDSLEECKVKQLQSFVSRSEDNGGERRFSSEVRNEDTVLCTLNVMNPSEFAVCYIYI